VVVFLICDIIINLALLFFTALLLFFKIDFFFFTIFWVFLVGNLISVEIFDGKFCRKFRRKLNVPIKKIPSAELSDGIFGCKIRRIQAKSVGHLSPAAQFLTPLFRPEFPSERQFSVGIHPIFRRNFHRRLSTFLTTAHFHPNIPKFLSKILSIFHYLSGAPQALSRGQHDVREE